MPAPAAQAEGSHFRHEDHVSKVWWEASKGSAMEVSQDCRTCHTFVQEDPDEDSLVSGPQFPSAEQCYACHIEGVVEVRGTEQGLDHRKEYKTLFRHYEHLNMECAECHRPDTLQKAGERRLQIPEKPGHDYCARCHNSGDSGGYSWRVVGWIGEPGEGVQTGPDGDSKSRSQEQMVNIMVNGVRKRPGSDSGEPDGPFEHEKHLKPEELKAYNAGTLEGGRMPNACLQCHKPVMDAQSRAGDDAGAAAQFEYGLTLASCRECHRSSSQNEVFMEDYRPRPSRAVGTFLHEMHLRAGSATGCVDCHAWNADDLAFEWSGEPGEAGGLSRQCFNCHDGQDGRPGAAQSPELASLHEFGLGSDCLKCHTDVADETGHVPWEDIASQRGVDQVAQFAQLTYRRPSFQHSGLEDGVDAKGRACADCHKQPFAELDADSVPTAFRHSDHMLMPSSGGPVDDVCQRCHKGIGELGEPNAWADPLGGYLEQYFGAELAADPQGTAVASALGHTSCSSCHAPPGDKTVPWDLGSSGEREVLGKVRFAHSDHGEVKCSECHSFQPGAEQELQLNQGVQDCTACHDHEAHDLVPAQRELRTVATQDCVECHREGGMPLHVASIEVDRLHYVLGGKFEHPLSNDGKRCSECHFGESYSEWESSNADLTSAPTDELRVRFESDSELWLSPSIKGVYSPHFIKHTDTQYELLERLLAEGGGGEKPQTISGQFTEFLHPSRKVGDFWPQIVCVHCHFSDPRHNPQGNLTGGRSISPSQARKMFGWPLQKTEKFTGWIVGAPGLVSLPSVYEDGQAYPVTEPDESLADQPK